MALTAIPYQAFKNADDYEGFYDFFTKVEIIRKDYETGSVIFRVQGQEVPKEDIPVSITFAHFPGIKPFIISIELI